MRASREVMARRHDEIISQTSKMLRERGIAGTSLADLMAAVGLTHGGFYKHFESKDVLVAEATERIFSEINTQFAEHARSQGAKAALKSYVDDYLTTSHVKNPELGCPIPSYGPDAGRDGGVVRETFTAGMKTTLSLIECGLSCPQKDRHDRAIELITMLSGAVLMARVTTDDKLVNQILALTRRRALKLIEARS